MWSAALWAATDTTEDEADVLSIGGSVTEIVYALDQQHRLIARDTTSTYPPDASQLPDVGYMRALSPEGVLSVAPKLILSEEGAGPPETIELLEAASIPFITIKDDYSASGVVDKILAVGQALDVEPEAQKLADEVASALNTAVERSAMAERKRVLFILSTQGGRILASGTDTAADGIIRMAGGINAVSAFEGYKPMTDEAISLAAPDVILMMDRRGDHSTGDADLFAMPAIATTPAAATGSVVRMNGLYLLGFGPRTADAVTDLNTALYEHD
nr:ABC transporter substrate-binding protein [Actibacterium sp. 188UL27-1]